MNDSLSSHFDKSSPTGADSGDERRYRLREFHERKSRSAGFYAKPQTDSGPVLSESQDWKVTKFEGDQKEGKALPKVFLIVLLVFVVGLVAGFAGFTIGRDRGKKAANWEMVQRAKTLKPLPEADGKLLSEAIAELRGGNAETALETFYSLRTKHPQAASLSYLAALAAIHAGQSATAESLASDSIKLGQRVSDSLALLSAIERQQAAATGGSATKAEELLRAAITADTANPTPHLELAALLRRTGRRDEAREEIKAAKTRLNPVDAHAVTEVTLALMELEDKADDQVFLAQEAPRNLKENLVAAYAAMRQGDFAAAAKFLRASQAMASPDVFFYLVGDPVFRKYRDRSEIADFFR